MGQCLSRQALPPLCLAAAAILIAEGLSRFDIVPRYLLPAPTQVLGTVAKDAPELAVGLGQTALAAVVGLTLSISGGGGLAVLLSISSLARRAFYPYAVFFQTVPVVSIAPLLVVWFGFGLPTTIASAFLVSVFPVIANTLVGLTSTDPGLADVFRLYGASARQTLFWLRLPAALPQILAGVRVAAGLAVIGAVVGEFIAGGGLGGIVDAARTQQRVDMVFAAVLVTSLLGLAMIALIDALARPTLKAWHPSASDR